jgi:cytochrome oxidase Cu insertion factor (SCO1/SenC/PrrC family)
MGQRSWRDEVLPQVNAENVVFVTLDVDPNNSAASFAQYADDNGFSWVFAVATPELIRALSEQFGASVTVPPTEPQWMIRPDGSIVGLISDSSPDSLVSLINGT